MKSLFYTIAVILFSAIIIKPLTPKSYPPPIVLEQRRIILAKEQKLDNLIAKIEYNSTIDSLEIIEVKQHE